MNQGSRAIPQAMAGMPGARLPAGKQWMALNALSDLNSQIAEHPDFYSLLNLLLLTLCGQYTVANAFAVIRNPRTTEEPPILFATGQFEKSRGLASSDFLAHFRDYFDRTDAPYWNTEVSDDGCPYQVRQDLIAHEVRLVVPLRRDGQLMGLLGLGRRPQRDQFTDSETELLLLLVNAVSPFMATLSREYFDLFNSVHQGVMVFDTEGCLMRINANAMRTIGELSTQPADVSTAYGTPLAQVFDDPTFSGWARELTRVDSNPRGHIVNGLIAKSPAGERVYSARVSTINLKDDGSCDLLIVLEDVTKQVQHEQHLYELQRLAEQGVMVSSISHELNNHMGLIVGGLELIETLVERGMLDKASTKIEKLLKHLSQVTRYTAGLTDRSRIECKKDSEQLNDVVSDILSFVKVQRKFKHLTLDVQLAPALPMLYIDRDQISQLLLNLLYNASDAIEEAKREAGHIEVETVAEDGFVRLTVRDNGVGIPEEVRNKLFQQRLTTKAKGHGFGLIMCSKIAKDHKAEVKIDSEPGKGTSFEFRFPITIAEANQAHTDADSASPCTN